MPYRFHVRPEAFASFVERQQRPGFTLLTCPHEDVVERGGTVYWFEQCEVVETKSGLADTAKEAKWPQSSRTNVVVRFLVGKESKWAESNSKGEFVDLGQTANGGADTRELYQLQDYSGEDPGANIMTEISQGKLGGIILTALGFDTAEEEEFKKGIGGLRVDSEGNVDLVGYFESKELVGKWLWVKFSKGTESWTDKKTKHERKELRVRAVSVMPSS